MEQYILMETTTNSIQRALGRDQDTSYYVPADVRVFTSWANANHAIVNLDPHGIMPIEYPCRTSGETSRP